MKYLILCLFVAVVGFWIGRKTPVPTAAPVIVPQSKKVAVAPHPDSHSEGIVEQIQQGRQQAQELKDLAAAPQISPEKMQVLLAQVKNKKESLILRRQVAFTLRKHMDESQWRILLSQMDPRLKEAISLNSNELLEGYIRASR
ncbi:hypothetical protein [Bdellovibrio sp. HCB2-146]|uniref:hypothetical protein n=1 Tax=Bdellovibrio sp. HCB2-146 TaxID=3394362 RepID=UPI0039BC4A48